MKWCCFQDGDAKLVVDRNYPRPEDGDSLIRSRMFHEREHESPREGSRSVDWIVLSAMRSMFRREKKSGVKMIASCFHFPSVSSEDMPGLLVFARLAHGDQMCSAFV